MQPLYLPTLGLSGGVFTYDGMYKALHAACPRCAVQNGAVCGLMPRTLKIWMQHNAVFEQKQRVHEWCSVIGYEWMEHIQC